MVILMAPAFPNRRVVDLVLQFCLQPLDSLIPQGGHGATCCAAGLFSHCPRPGGIGPVLRRYRASKADRHRDTCNKCQYA
jgi:hypothetical protein